MRIIKLQKKELNDFLSKQKYSQFLQSFEWGEFQEILGNKVFRLGVEENKELIAVATLVKKYLPGQKIKSYFFCPRGPVFKSDNKKYIKFLFNEIKKIAKKENVVFLRFEPEQEIKNKEFSIKKTIDIQPKKTLILDISKEKEDILKNMHQKTRYNIRLAERKGVEVSELKDLELNEFWKIIEETSKRDGFRSHPREYYEKMFNFNKDFLKFYVARYEGKIISCLIAVFSGNMATYTHGASSNNNRNVMAPYLLQWHAICKSKEKGYKYYDFHGIDEEKWPGVTRFKKGFNGSEMSYSGTFDLVFDKSWYFLYKFVRWVRRKLK